MIYMHRYLLTYLTVYFNNFRFGQDDYRSRILEGKVLYYLCMGNTVNGPNGRQAGVYGTIGTIKFPAFHESTLYVTDM